MRNQDNKVDTGVNCNIGGGSSLQQEVESLKVVLGSVCLCRETAFCSHLRRRPRHLSRERERRFYYSEERYAQEGPHRISIPARLGQVRIETIIPRRSYAGFSLRGYESPLRKLLQRNFMKAINIIHYSRRSSFALDSVGFTGERPLP